MNYKYIGTESSQIGYYNVKNNIIICMQHKW